MLAMMRERGYTANKRSREFDRDTPPDTPLKEGEEWAMMRDFETGEMKRVRRVKSGVLPSASAR